MKFKNNMNFESKTKITHIEVLSNMNVVGFSVVTF